MALQPTDEQQAILDAAGTGKTVAISARAGTGKTSTLRMIAEAAPSKQMLYLAFNKTVQAEAERSFPPNVTAKTAHALAFPEFGSKIIHRIKGDPLVPAWKAAQILGLRDVELDGGQMVSAKSQAALVNEMVARFCHSADERPRPKHLRPVDGLSSDQQRALANRLVPYAERAWEDMTRPRGRLKPTFDVFLKQWQLSHPKLAAYDIILYDEAQDADPAVADVVEHQDHAQLIAVGDSAQAIYGWRGAGDFLARVKAEHRLPLTQSWRFGSEVADEGNLWLAMVDPDPSTRVRGRPGHASTIGPLQRSDAVLCRTNAGTIAELLDAQAAGLRVHLVGDGKEIAHLASACEQLQAGKPVSHPDLAGFSTWEQVVDFAENDPAGSDLAVAVRLVERFGASTIARAVESSAPANRADLVVSTAHKAKGREWSRVRTGVDYPEPRDKKTGERLPVPPTFAMLAYVAVTRAKDHLDPAGLAWVHDRPEGQPALPEHDKEPSRPVDLGAEAPLAVTSPTALEVEI